jgi:GAF domain-containing protein
VTAASAIGQAMASATCAVYEYAPTHQLTTLKATWSADGDPDADLLVGVPFPLADRASLRQAILERRTTETHVNDPGLSPAERDEMWSDLTVLATPLVFRGEVLGALTHAEKSIRRTTPPERELFERLAAIAALSIGNARLFAGQQDHNRHLGALLEASRAVSSTVVLDEVLSVLARKAADALSIVRCRVYEFDATSAVLAERTGYVAPYDGGELPPAPDIDDPSSVVRRALSSGEIETERLMRPAAARHGRLHLRKVPAQYLTRFAVPIVFGGTPLGAMAFLESRGEREFSVTEIELARRSPNRPARPSRTPTSSTPSSSRPSPTGSRVCTITVISTTGWATRSHTRAATARRSHCSCSTSTASRPSTTPTDIRRATKRCALLHVFCRPSSARASTCWRATAVRSSP